MTSNDFSIFFLIFLSVLIVVVVSAPSNVNLKSKVENNKLSELNAKPYNREKRQSNYVSYYQPYYGYQSYYVNPYNKPTRVPHRRNSSTTQRYSIWQLTRKRRSDDTQDSKPVTVEKESHKDLKKRQTDNDGVDFGFYPYFFRQPFGIRSVYPEGRNQRYTM